MVRAPFMANFMFPVPDASFVIRRGHKQAIIAVGHKILRIIFVILKKLEPYKDPQVNYEEMLAKKDAPRWIKALKKYGYRPAARQSVAN